MKDIINERFERISAVSWYATLGREINGTESRRDFDFLRCISLDDPM